MTKKRRLSEPFEIADPEEVEQLENLQIQFKILEIIRERMPGSAVGFPQPKSSLAGDDKATDPYHLSHVVGMSLGVALDQLKALENLIITARSVHPYGTFSLIRSAIENAATALWLLSPASRQERVTRRLQLLQQDAYNQNKAHQAMPKVPVTLSLEDRLKKIRDVADRQGIGKLARFKVTDVVREVGNIRGFSIEGAWQITSGITHGQQWAILNLLSRDSDEDAEGVFDALVSAGLTQVVWGVECARLPIQEAQRLLLERGTSHIG